MKEFLLASLLIMAVICTTYEVEVSKSYYEKIIQQ